MRKRKLVIVLVLVALVVTTAIVLTKVLTFKSNETWVEVTNQDLPKQVLDTLMQQKKNGRFDYVTLLDSKYDGKIFFDITNNHALVFAYDYYTIGYLDKKIIIKKEYLNPPFVIFEDKIYAELYQKFGNDGVTPLHVQCTSLK